MRMGRGKWELRGAFSGERDDELAIEMESVM